jgi:HEAT repeat protein
VRFSYIFGVLGWATALSAVLVAQRGSAPEEPAIAAVSGQRDSNSANPTANGIIVGAVVNERDEPVANARVHAFPAHAPMSNPQSDPIVPRSMRASGSAATDSSGRFQISNLELGDYLVLVEPVPFVPSAGSTRPSTLYAMTFYPSAIEDQSAMPVSALPYAATTIRITLVRVQGVRVSGSVVSSSGRPTRGKRVTLFRQIGGFGESLKVAVVDENGRFEIPRVPPSWYRLTVADEPKKPMDPPSDFASTLIEVRDRDITDLSLVSGAGASIAGRVVAEPGVDISNGVGLRVSASRILEQYSLPGSVSATADYDGAFRMTGLSGSYTFGAGTDRPPAVQATRVRVDGAEWPATRPLEFSTGAHEVIVFVGPRVPPKATFDRTLPTSVLVEQFKNEKAFWRQAGIAKEILVRRDASVIPALTTSLNLEDRHVRGNAALIVAGLGEARGLQVITDILTDQSERPEGQGIPGAGWSLPAQIRADRYYAAHLLGDLRDPRAVSILIPLLKDKDVQSIVPWSLGEIGDRRAIGPLIDVLDERDPSMRVLAIYALETLNAKEALPRLFELAADQRTTNFGGLVSVADAAKAAIAKLK